MNKFECERGLGILTTEFEKKIDQKRSDQIFKRISSWSGTNWMQAVERIIIDPEQRIFPRLGGILQALGETSRGQKKEQQYEKIDCACEDGLVFYRKGEHSYIGTCSRCRRGPKAYPLVDPVTLQIAETERLANVSF